MVKQTEYELQVQCVQYLEQLKTQCRVDLFTAIPNSTFIPQSSAKFKILAKLKQSGVRGGLCDLLLVVNGIPYFIELKTVTGGLSPKQKEWVRSLNSKFYLAFIACSFEEFSLLVDDCIDSSVEEIETKNTRYAQANLEGRKMLKRVMGKV